MPCKPGFYLERSVSRTVQFPGRKFVTFVNGSYQRCGTLWEGLK